MDFTFSIKDLVLLITTVGSLMAIYFGLKYKTKRNEEHFEETEGSLDKFKGFVYKELKDIDKQLKEINKQLHDVLNKKEAEEKYMTKKEHDLIMKNIGLQLKTIVEKLDDLKGETK